MAIIFRNLKGQAGSNWRLGENLILTSELFNLIGRSSIVGQGSSSVRQLGLYAWFNRTFI